MQALLLKSTGLVVLHKGFCGYMTKVSSIIYQKEIFYEIHLVVYLECFEMFIQNTRANTRRSTMMQAFEIWLVMVKLWLKFDRIILYFLFYFTLFCLTLEEIEAY